MWLNMSFRRKNLLSQTSHLCGLTVEDVVIGLGVTSCSSPSAEGVEEGRLSSSETSLLVSSSSIWSSDVFNLNLSSVDCKNSFRNECRDKVVLGFSSKSFSVKR